MKYLFALFATLLLLLAAHNSSAATNAAPGKAVKCTAHFEFGSITATGPTIHAARSSVSEKCMDRRLDEFTAVRARVPDGEQADMMIDSCVNITCK